MLLNVFAWQDIILPKELEEYRKASEGRLDVIHMLRSAKLAAEVFHSGSVLQSSED